MGLVTSDIEAAAIALAAGRLCAIPTETVYGLAADASRESAVAAVFVAKGRPTDHPLIVHVASTEEITNWISSLPAWATQLAAAYMPGPLTIVGPRTSAASDAVTGGQDTVAVRVPSHPVARQLLGHLRNLGVAGLVAPSANTFGHVSPTTAEHVERDLGEYLKRHAGLILQGGACSVGLESTIVLATGESPIVLRPGAVSRDMIAATTGIAVSTTPSSAPRVSGSLASHYAPSARVHTYSPDEFAAARGLTGGLIAMMTVPDRATLARIAAPADASALARELYAALRAADDLGLDDVHVVIPDGEEAIVEALADRVSRAGAPRDPWTMTP